MRIAAPRPRFVGPRGALLAATIAAGTVAGCDETSEGCGAPEEQQSSNRDAGSDASQPADAATATEPDAGDWVPTPIYEAIPPRR